MSNVPHSVDTALVSDMQRINNQQAPVQPVTEVASPDVSRRTSEAPGAETQPPVTHAEEPAKEPTDSVDISSKLVDAPADEKPVDAASSSPIDEYGNPIAAPKMYTEDEVNEIMRRRNARG